MSENQLTIVPDPAADEAVVVDRFVQASREIVPGLQVSLAKRVICPGSNRVLCLAAQTSVPMNDDEIASVSDLALRLSDGTNVRLSLSYFNDAVEANFQVPFARPNFTRSFYDPERYRSYSDTSGDSKLGAVLFAMSVIAVASLTLAVFGPLSNYMHVSKTPDREKPVVSLLTPHPILPVLAPAAKVAAPARALTPKHVAAPTKVRHHRSSSTAVVHQGGTHEPGGLMLVPPPPPFTPSAALFPQSPVSPVQIPISPNIQVKPQKAPVTTGAKKGSTAQALAPVKSVPQAQHSEESAAEAVPAAEQRLSHPNRTAVAKPVSHADSIKALQEQMMMPMYAYARAQEGAKQDQPHQSQRLQAANHVIDSSFAGNVDPAMHLAPLPGGDDTSAEK